MRKPKTIRDEALSALALPLKSIGAAIALDHAETMGEGKVFGEGKYVSDPKSRRPILECSLIDLESMVILSGKTTPIHAWEHGTGISSITMCYSGSPKYTGDGQEITAHRGEILVVPRNGERISTGYLSSINFPISHDKLLRTAQAMLCADNTKLLQQAFLVNGESANQSAKPQKLLFKFFRYVDLLLRESRYIGKAMALDD